MDQNTYMSIFVHATVAILIISFMIYERKRGTGMIASTSSTSSFRPHLEGGGEGSLDLFRLKH